MLAYACRSARCSFFVFACLGGYQNCEAADMARHALRALHLVAQLCYDSAGMRQQTRILSAADKAWRRKHAYCCILSSEGVCMHTGVPKAFISVWHGMPSMLMHFVPLPAATLPSCVPVRCTCGSACEAPLPVAVLGCKWTHFGMLVASSLPKW